MSGRKKIICLGKVGLLTFALISGAIYAYSVNHIIPAVLKLGDGGVRDGV